jgi:Peptidase inhibitor I78 family
MNLERMGRRGVLQAMALLAVGGAEAGGDDSPGPCPDMIGMVLRVVHPGDAVTMDYREDRITIEVDDDNVIQSISIG